MTGVFILLMAASLFLSPRDISIEYALLNRAFFAFILVISSIFIEEYVSNVEGLALSEERYRYLTECSPDGIIVYRQGGIEYVNPAGMRFLGADRRETLIGRDIIDMIDPEQKALVRERVAQAALGARMVIDKVRLVGQDRNQITVGISLASVFWNKGESGSDCDEKWTTRYVNGSWIRPYHGTVPWELSSGIAFFHFRDHGVGRIEAGGFAV